ncbi:MAG: protease complex subunit PrcB family protein [Lachnospiraceae bacterium]|nr:protease complex subunit PrcB family protein [Lachnospiraceae bacterium]
MKKNTSFLRKLCALLSAVLFCTVLFAGCGLEETDSQKLEDLPYTILEEKEIPQEFLSVIEEKKEEIFKLTYTDQENLYIAAGYGAQQTGGYSIAVNQCYLTKNAIYFDTTLIGPSKGEQVSQAKSYPYLVIKTKYSEKSVVFE